MAQLTAAEQVTQNVGTRRSARTTWLTVHRWLGLTVGLLIVLIGLTGSVLVFEHAIDEWLNPDLLLTHGSGTRRTVQEVIDAAERHSAGQALSVTKPRVKNGVWTVWFSNRSEDDPQFTAVYVDPWSAAVTGSRVWGEYLVTCIYRLHFELLSGTVGAVLVGICGILMMVSVVSGVYLWWPMWRHSWRSAFAVRRGSRLHFDLHKTLGIVSAGFLLILAFTGVYMEFPQLVKPLVKMLSAETLPPQGLKSAGSTSRQRISADEALKIAQQQFSHAVFDHLHPPDGPEGTYEVAFRLPEEVQQTFGRTQVFLDQFDGRILALRNPEDFTSADVFLAWQFPLHSGEAFGLIGRWAVFTSGLMPAILYVTGFWIWLRKRQAQHKQEQRHRAARPTPAAQTSERTCIACDGK
ncbi:MAG: PepSY-associated TM helix domain-containing protein [Pirellulaceae bacterium]